MAKYGIYPIEAIDEFHDYYLNEHGGMSRDDLLQWVIELLPQDDFNERMEQVLAKMKERKEKGKVSLPYAERIVLNHFLTDYPDDLNFDEICRFIKNQSIMVQLLDVYQDWDRSYLVKKMYSLVIEVLKLG